MRFTFLVVFVFSINLVSAQINLNQLKKAANKAQEVISTERLSKDEITKGLKEALIIGAENSVFKASEKGGFNNNYLIRISFPKNAEKMKITLVKIGMQSEVDKFEHTLNKAAEDASIFAKEILINAVKNMSINNAIIILKGGDDDATMYLKKQTSQQIYAQFYPIIKKSIEKVHLTKYWRDLSERYNQIPLTKKVNTDLVEYVTIQTLEGLFFLISNEEEKIRNNPKARVSEILQKVFK